MENEIQNKEEGRINVWFRVFFYFLLGLIIALFISFGNLLPDKLGGKDILGIKYALSFIIFSGAGMLVGLMPRKSANNPLWVKIIKWVLTLVIFVIMISYLFLIFSGGPQ